MKYRDEAGPTDVGKVLKCKDEVTDEVACVSTRIPVLLVAATDFWDVCVTCILIEITSSLKEPEPMADEDTSIEVICGVGEADIVCDVMDVRVGVIGV